MESKHKCEAGCVLFTGGERRHHKDCVFYQESFSKRFDELEKSHAELLNALKASKKLIDNLEKEHEEIAHELMIVDDMIMIEQAIKNATK